MSDIIDRIDELVDAQLAEGESSSDYQNNDPAYPRCPHCNRHWHGLRITRRIEDMQWRGQYDEDYSVTDDDSAVLCEGSEFIGPQQAPASSWTYSVGSLPGWQFLGFIDEATPRRDINYTYSITITPNIPSQTVIFPRWTVYNGDWFPLWTSQPDPEPVCSTPAPEGIEVEFGPQNWVHEFRRIPGHSQWSYLITQDTRAVSRLWDQFNAPDYPVPRAPGIDTAALEATMKAFNGGTGPELPSLRQRRLTR